MVKAIQGSALLVRVRELKQVMAFSPRQTAWFNVRGEMIAKQKENGIFLNKKQEWIFTREKNTDGRTEHQQGRVP